MFTSIYNNTNTPVTVTVTCTPSSPKATCSVPSNINIPANTSNGPTVTYTVPSINGAARPVLPFTAPFVFASVLAGLSCTKPSKRHTVLALLILALLLTMVSCGGGGGGSSGVSSGGGTVNPRSFTFTVTATGGGNTDSQTFTVNLQ